MNRITRNLALVLGAALASTFTASVLLYLEARSGHPLFGFMQWGFVPAGAIGAGLVAAVGLLGCAMLLRARPAPVVVIGLMAVSAGTVFVVQSADATISSAGRVAASDPALFGQFLENAAVHSPIQFSDAGSSSSPATTSLNPGLGPAIPQTGADNDAQVQSLSTGVQGVVASRDVGTNVAAGGAQRISEIGDNIHSIGSNVQNHGAQWLLMALQFAGFSIGSLLVYSLLRSRPYCEDCHLLLSKKGAQTRYFDRVEDINGSVEDVLAKAKNRRLQLSIQTHGSRGAAQKSKSAEFASTIRVSLCMRCQTHRMDFRAMRKSGASWKEIAVLGYSASSFESLEVTG
jgi:hypothetical protein